MEIIVGDIYSMVASGKNYAKEIEIIRSICRARPDGYKFMPKYRDGYWDGYISLMHGYSKFPTGLLPLVVSVLESHGIDITIKRDHNTIPYIKVEPDFLRGITLRDYQVDAANIMLSKGRGVAKMATNSGKTEVMAAIIKALDFPNTVVVLHRKELMYQTAQRFEDRLNAYVGMIGDGIKHSSYITVAMIQTLSRINDLHNYIPDTQLVMVDECHHASSSQMMDVLCKINGQYRYGFSGTPLKYDVLSDMKLMAVTGDIIVETSNEFLITEGFSATPKVEIFVVEGDGWNMNYHEAYKSYIVENKGRNNAIKHFALKDTSGTTLILVNQIKHGKILKELIPGAVFVTGSDTTEYRQNVLDIMRKQSGIFIATPIFDEGVDVPSVDTVILAGGGRSHVKLLQRIGRGMRKKSGNNRLLIVDFIDDTNKYLLKHSEDRIELYYDEKFETTLV